MAVIQNVVLWKYINSENCYLLHVITEWKSIYYFTCGLDVPLRTIEWNLAHMWEIRTLWLLKGNLYGQNRAVFHPWIKEFWGEVLLSSAVKDLNKPEIHNFFGKPRFMVVNTSTQWVTSIPRTIVLTNFSKRSLFQLIRFKRETAKIF